ncbi:MAG TPA: PIN domain-containing protein [Thermoanaerobaculia bacterium]|nr:PIN domain-containing protein [Thermoanaerobaculia bacterium]
MADLSAPFFDTSVLVAGLIDFGETSRSALEVVDAIADGRITRPLTAWHCCLEFFSVATRLPEEYRLEPETALRFLKEEVLARFDVAGLARAAREEFLAAAVGEGAVGGRIYDAHIAEVARRMGASIVVTENRRHFTSLLRHGVQVLLCEELATEL